MGMRTIGRTQLAVTELGFGASGIGNLGHAVSDDVAMEAVRAAWDTGIRLFDTAPHYGLGLSERRLGAALAGVPRREFVLSTKVGRLIRPNPLATGADDAGGFSVPDDFTRVWDFSADGVRRSLAESLERLGMDRIDIVYVHDPDDAVDQAIAEAIPALIALRDAGVVSAVGVGMNQSQAPLRFVRETDIDVVMLAGRWTLLDRSGELLLNECLERGVGVVAAAPFNSGILARRWPSGDDAYDYGATPPEVLERARGFASICESAGTTLPTAALQYPLRHPAVASVVVGLRTREQVTLASSRMAQPISHEVWQRLG